jgi:O-antigen/teichoic acid export membrane protein
VNWLTSVFYQVLVANDQMPFIQLMLVAKSILSLAAILMTVFMRASLTCYYVMALSANAAILIPYFLVCRARGYVIDARPGWDWPVVKPIVVYSLSVFVTSFFQFTAAQSRPLILSAFGSGNPAILTEYKVLEAFPQFVITIASTLIAILLPETSRLVQENNSEKIRAFAYGGTKLSTILLAFLCFPFMLNASEVLDLYVGPDYVVLAKWLILWFLTLAMYLYNAPIASLLLSSGRMMSLVVCTIVSCLLSIAINAALCPSLGVGSAVVGFFVYIAIQMIFYYFFLNSRVLGLRSWLVFRAFLLPTLAALLPAAPIFFWDAGGSTGIVAIAVRSVVWALAFVAILRMTKQIELKSLIANIRNRSLDGG